VIFDKEEHRQHGVPLFLLEETMKKVYIYEGSVLKFGKCVERCWRSSTIAPTARKARSNLAYQYKTTHNLQPYAAITLPGKVVEVKEGI